ncbi:hypothetical protein SCLCIDRAFT_657665 [Scleroderma citrinum Foug A]|uniref:Uncharacterized protein n=1 Tax=Scleroderma citrinum Foug A TaxID=1036808 RepID=A0A0C3DU28_9AGAM|nr:hypothetical protein SCLCIDRAFT_657665 [Scleroderma citrinum Foug A]
MHNVASQTVARMLSGRQHGGRSTLIPEGSLLSLCIGRPVTEFTQNNKRRRLPFLTTKDSTDMCPDRDCRSSVPFDTVRDGLDVHSYPRMLRGVIDMTQFQPASIGTIVYGYSVFGCLPMRSWQRWR